MCSIFSQISPEPADEGDDEDEDDSVTSVSIFDDASMSTLSVILPPHQRCAAHTLNLVASRDTEKAMEDSAFKTASRSMFAKANAIWNKQSRTVQAAGMCDLLDFFKISYNYFYTKFLIHKSRLLLP